MKSSDVIKTEQHSYDIIDLKIIQKSIRKEIANYELVKSEYLYDDDEDRVYKAFTFNRGINDYEVVIHPDFLIKASTEATPSSLIVEISNLLVCILYASIKSGEHIRRGQCKWE